MREKTVKRFYCDHCGKGRFHKSAMKRHELACAYNADRKCPLCEDVQIQHSMSALLAAKDRCSPSDIQPLREAAGGCPACMLAAIVQGRGIVTVMVGPDEDRDQAEWVDFSYEKELQDWYQSQDVYSL